MIDQATANMLARYWLDGNNAYDLEMIMEPFARNVVFSSPFVSRLTGDPEKTTITGYDALRKYIAESLPRVPGIHYVLDANFVGTDSIIIVYTCHLPGGKIVHGADSMRVDSTKKIVEWRCHYTFSLADVEHSIKG